MPKYLVEMHDGRKFQVEADSQPTEAEVMAHLGEQSAPSATAADMLSGRRVTSDAPTTPGLTDNLNQALQHAAHPQTGMDMAGLIAAPVDATRSAAASIIGQLPLRSIATGTLRTAGSVLESPLTNVAISPKARYLGKMANALADRIQPTASAVPEAAPLAPTGPHMDRSMLARPSEMTPQQLTERIAGGTGTPAPTTGQVTGQLRPASAQPSLPPEFAPVDAPAAQASTAPMQAADPHARLLEKLGGNGPPLQEPRIATGAEKVGREMGLSKEAVRQQTNPILGEAPGEASPIFPRETLGKIVDAVKALPVSEREAYVARATSGKAQWQIENIRRTLEHLGLMVPAAIGIEPAVRERLQSLMHSGTQ